MSDKPANDPAASQKRRTFLKRMAAAGLAAGAVITFEPMVAHAVTENDDHHGRWHWRPTSTTTTTTTPAPTTTTTTTTPAPHHHHRHHHPAP